jgi:hypothetical protein
LRFDVILGEALRRAACPHATDCSKFRLDETLWSSTIIYRRCKSQYIRRSHFLGKDDRIVFYNAATYALAGKAAFAKRNIFACERDGFNLVAGRARTLGKGFCQSVGIAVFSERCAYN